MNTSFLATRFARRSGECGTGIGTDTFTSGFEGPWTSHPTRYDNDYFKYLLDFDWEVRRG